MNLRTTRTVLSLLLLSISSSGVFAQLAIDEVAPPNLGRMRNGEAVSLLEQPGKVHAVTFWASWCGPCRVELPMLEKLQRALGPEKVRIIAVNIEERETFRKETRGMFDWQMTLSNDPLQSAQASYKGGPIPHLTIIGRDGKVRKVFIGYAESKLREVVTAVVDAVNE